MMEAGRCVEILDPYDWLPGHGENAVRTSQCGPHLSVVVEYDGKNGKPDKKEFIFEKTAAYCQAAFPGPLSLDLTFSVKGDQFLSSLVEYPDSEAALAWVQHFEKFGHYSRIVKHYRIFFMAENIQLIVFAQNVILKDVITEER
jgi:hypothetical protein